MAAGAAVATKRTTARAELRTVLTGKLLWVRAELERRDSVVCGGDRGLGGEDTSDTIIKRIGAATRGEARGGKSG
jgi:hypothetical protein